MHAILTNTIKLHKVIENFIVGWDDTIIRYQSVTHGWMGLFLGILLVKFKFIKALEHYLRT